MSPELRKSIERVRCVTLDVDGVLTDGRIVYGSDGTEFKSFNVQDGLGIKNLQSMGIHVAIISGRASSVVERRASELGIRHLYQEVEDKVGALRHLLDEVNCEAIEVAHIGDDEPDREVFKEVGVAVAVANAVPAVKKDADIVTQLPGGAGAVREFCDLVRTTHTEART